MTTKKTPPKKPKHPIEVAQEKIAEKEAALNKPEPTIAEAVTPPITEKKKHYLIRRFATQETATAIIRILIYIPAYILTEREPNFFYKYWFGAVMLDILIVQLIHLFTDNIKREAARRKEADKLIASKVV